MKFGPYFCHGRICHSIVSETHVSFFFFDKGFSKKWLQKKIILVINEFDVKVIDGSSKVLILTDNLGAPISVHKFVETIKTFHCGSSYYVDVQYESTVVSSPLAVVTPLVRYLFL